MAHDASKLGDVEQGERWQPARHYSTAAESKDATAIRNEGVHLADQVDLAGQRLVETASDVVKFGEQQRMGAPIERCARRFEFFAPRHQRPQHGPSDENATKKQDGELRQLSRTVGTTSIKSTLEDSARASP